MHIDDTLDITFVDNILEKMALVVNKSIGANEEIYAFVLGDIINKGDENAERKYRIAEQIFIKLQEKIDVKNLKLCFIPGNHDVCSKQLTYFDLFIKKFSCVSIKFETTSLFQETIDKLNFVFADSVTHRERNNGKVDIGEIEKLHPDILCLHHSIDAQHDWFGFTYDATDILNLGCNFIFHGHTHGASFNRKGLTNIISVGSLLLDYSKPEYGNINNQFNLIEIKNSTVSTVSNFRYFGDIKSFEPTILYALENNNMVSEWLSKIIPKDIIYIEREVIPCSEMDENEIQNLFSNSKKSLAEALKDDNLILLVGEAGIGKSFELKKLYDDNVNSNIFYPLHFSIRDCALSEIIDKIKNHGKYTNNKKVLYIFDGLDEVEPESRNEFVKLIRTHFTKLSGKTAVISTRENFAVEINDFKKYRLLKISDRDVKNYINKHGVLTDDFNSMVTELKCQSEIKVPFYLSGLINAFQRENATSTKVDIMEILISARISNDIEKYDTTVDLKTVKYNLMYDLQEIAFAMQLIKEYSLSDQTYQTMFQPGTRKLINYFGAFSYRTDKKVWEFEHNNFREYLAAKYLNQLSFDEIISVIVYDENNSKLRPSWLNVVAYLLPMQNNSKLVDWLIDNAKDALCNFESDKVTLVNRDQLFMAVMNDAISKQLPIFTLYDVSKLGRYFQSDEAIRYMLKVLKINENNSAISSVLHILRYCDDFYGKEKELKAIIIEKTLRDIHYEHIVILSVEVLTRIFSNDLPNLTKEIFEILHMDKRSRVYGALCDLFVEADVVDEYINFIFESINTNAGLFEDFSTNHSIVDALTNVKDIRGVSTVIRLYCNNNLPYVLNGKDKIFAHNCVKATELYNQGEIDILTTMIDCFISMASKCDKRKCQVLKEFFVETKTLPTVFQNMLNRKLRTDSMMFIIEDIMDERLEDILIAKYLNGDLIDEAFKWYARRLPIDSAIFMKLDDAVCKKESVRISREPQIDWDKNRKDGHQKYFNCLFNKDLFSKLVDELLFHIVNNDITCEQLVSISSDEIYDFSVVPHEREDLQSIRAAMYHSGLKTQKVTQFLDYIDWEVFCVFEMRRMLENYEEDIVLDEKQKLFIDDYLKYQFASINFEDYFNKNHIIRHLISLAIKSKFVFTDEKLLEMLTLPWYFFVSSTSSGKSETLDFVSKNVVDHQKLQNKIIENIRNKELTPFAAQTHILYCLENKLPDAINIAIELFNNNHKEADYRKNTAVDYLLVMKNNKFVDDLVPNITDKDLLVYLAYHIKTDNFNLIKKMTEENKKSESQTLFLRELLELNNRYALEKYLELATAVNCLPDLHPDDSRIEEITMAIRKINDISLIDVVSRLFELCYSDKFIDKESFGLRNSLDTVINNFTQVDKLRTKEVLTNLIKKHPENDKLISTCNWHLINIEKLIIVSNDLPWNLKETVVFLKSHRT